MANEVKLPRLGQGMEAGTVTKWLKSEGDTVAKGEPLFEVDTDKVTQEVESDFAGVLLKIALAVGRGAGRPDDRLHRRGRRRGRDSREPKAERRRAEDREPRPKAERAPEARTVSDQPSVDATTNGGRDQGLAARTAHRARARYRPARSAGHRARGPDRRRGRRARPGSRAERGRAGCRARGRGRVGPAHEHPQDDRAPADRRVAGARLPAHRHRRHDARERARRALRAS